MTHILCSAVILLVTLKTIEISVHTIYIVCTLTAGSFAWNYAKHWLVDHQFVYIFYGYVIMFVTSTWTTFAVYNYCTTVTYNISLYRFVIIRVRVEYVLFVLEQ